MTGHRVQDPTGRPLVIYVSGPYTAPSEDGVAANVRRAEDAAAALMRDGHTPLCPHSHSHGWERYGFAWGDFIRIDLVLLERCDAIYMLSGWEASKGALMEFEHAFLRRMPVYYQGKIEPGKATR